MLFLDELAEFSRQALDSLRQPLETGEIVIARANTHVRYPAKFQLVAAMNTRCCEYLSDPARLEQIDRIHVLEASSYRRYFLFGAVNG